MNHRDARLLLAEHAGGGADAASLAALQRHIGTCRQCAQWLETYDLLRAGLGGAVESEIDHPASDLLADWVTMRATVARPVQRQVVRHLRQCPTCRQEARSVASAVSEARALRFFSHRHLAAGRRPGTRWATMLAAGVAAALVAVVVLPRHSTQGERQVSTVSPPEALAVELNDRDLEGRHVIGGGPSLTLRGVRVKEGAEITFRAEERLALGDGVVIGSGTRVVFEIGHDSSALRRAGKAQTF